MTFKLDETNWSQGCWQKEENWCSYIGFKWHVREPACEPAYSQLRLKITLFTSISFSTSKSNQFYVSKSLFPYPAQFSVPTDVFILCVRDTSKVGYQEPFPSWIQFQIYENSGLDKTCVFQFCLTFPTLCIFFIYFLFIFLTFIQEKSRWD